MAHAVHTRDFGRNKSWRAATVRSLAQALLKKERIQTTRAKAKEAQRLTERLITLGKQGNLHARRQAVRMLNDVDLVGRLFVEIAPRFKNRAGGYTRILHGGCRPGDGAQMAWIELVELDVKPAPKPEKPVPKPAAEEKKPAAPKQPATPSKGKKPQGFLDGLRKLFKRRDNP